MRYNELIENTEPGDDELFGQDKYNFGNMTADEVKEKFNDLHDGLYGYDAHYNDEEDEAELQAELTALMNYVRRRFNNHFYEYLRRQLDQEAPDNWLERHNSRNTDPLGRRRNYDWPDNERLTKAGKLYKQDQKTAARVVKNRLGTHHTPNLPESSDASDEELFGHDNRPEIAQKFAQVIEWLIDRIEMDPNRWEDAEQSISELTHVEKYMMQGRLVDGLRALDVISDEKILDELDADLYREFDINLGKLEARFLSEGDSDRDLFGATPDSPARQELKKISIEELKQRRRELLAYVRTIARRHFNAATKVSGSKSFGTVTMLFGKEDQYSPNTQRLVAGVKAYLDDVGLQNKITDAGWLSVKVPDEVPTDLAEDSDEDLFGSESDLSRGIRLLKKLRLRVQQDPRGRELGEFLKQFDNSNSTEDERANHTLDFIAHSIGMSREKFDHDSIDFPLNPYFEWHRPWQMWDLKIINKFIALLQDMERNDDLGRPRALDEEDDDDLFGETTLISRIEQLLKTRQKVFTRVPGAMGQVMGVRDNSLILKTRPHSTTRYLWGGLENNPDRFKLERNAQDGRWYVTYAEDPWEVE